MSLFKKKSLIEVKQPQEYYCSNSNCINEVADLSPLLNLLTEEAHDNLAGFYCIDCITERRYE